VAGKEKECKISMKTTGRTRQVPIKNNLEYSKVYSAD
jgi:hypothetical protein